MLTMDLAMIDKFFESSGKWESRRKVWPAQAPGVRVVSFLFYLSFFF
jgi:hypothetical protein